MKEKIEESIKKIEMYHIVILITIIALISGFLYINNSNKLSKFQNEIIQTKNIGTDNTYVINQVKEEKYNIHCKLRKTNLKKEKYFNYVSGEGEGYKINFIILIKINNEYYKAKTIKTAEDNDMIELSACVNDKNINTQSSICLYDVNSKTILEY